MLTVDHAPIPFFSQVQYGLPDGGEIDLYGELIHGEKKHATLNLKTMDGIALHITFRLAHSNPIQVVFNSYHKGKWGHEDKHQINVGVPGPLNIHVESHHKHYVIGINGHTYEYKHRMKTSEIDRIEIDGDLRIQKLSFTNMDSHIHLLGNYHQSHHQ